MFNILRRPCFVDRRCDRMCLQRMWSISRDKDVPTKTMNRKVIDSQRVQGRVPQRRSLGVLGKDEVASSNLASSSTKALASDRRRCFFYRRCTMKRRKHVDIYAAAAIGILVCIVGCLLWSRFHSKAVFFWKYRKHV